MKTAYKIIVAALAACLFASCESFLDVDNPGKNTIDKFFKDVSSLNAASEGLHKSILTFYDAHYIRYADVAGDMLNILTVGVDEGLQKMHDFELEAEDNATYPRTLWLDGYSIITNANNIILYAPDLLSSYPGYKSTINRSMGYAYFARALAHFCMCQCYAQPYNYTSDASHKGIPVLTHIPGFEDAIPREPVSKVYAQVIADLNQAYGLLKENDSPDIYHASSTACEALLARVYLYMEDWTNAAKYARSVMDKVPLSPYDEYKDMFRNAATVPGKESIFRLNFYSTSCSMSNGSDPASAIQKFTPNPTIGSYYDLDDIRKQMLTYEVEEGETWSTPGTTYPAVTKLIPYKSIPDEKQRQPDLFVLRCSEMYLIHAEALCCGTDHDLAGAADDLKALIARGRNVPKESVPLAYTSQKDMEDLIERERIRELCYEGHRLFDITRRKKNLERSPLSSSKVRTITYPDYRFVLPISQLELQANEHMTQNDGYNGRK